MLLSANCVWRNLTDFLANLTIRGRHIDLGHLLGLQSPAQGHAVGGLVHEGIIDWQADGPGKVGEQDGLIHLEHHDRVALHWGLDHAHNGPLLLPRRPTL